MATERPAELIVQLAGELDLSSVQQTIEARAAQERALLDVAQRHSETPQTGWRYAWLQHRQALLMPAVVGDSRVNLLCLEHARAVRAIAATLRANSTPQAHAAGLLQALGARSIGLWSALAAHMAEARLGACAWPRGDGHELNWLYFCTLVLLGGRRPDGQPHSRRALSELLARIQTPKRSASTIRLKLLPQAEDYFEAADRWAALLAGARDED
jgi:hypothetical protein